jgi:hypothetical protein
MDQQTQPPPVATAVPDQPTVEPFGFTDGVSQPIIRGLRDNITKGQSYQVVEPEAVGAGT